jgi:hypothetical protein
MVKSSSDENQALVAHTRKGIRGSLGRRGSPGRRTSSEPRRRKDLSKIKCLECRDFGHYALYYTMSTLEGKGKKATNINKRG